MGSGFSTEEKIAYVAHRQMIDKAIRDSNYFQEFIKIRDTLTSDLRLGKKKVEVYCVNYIKILIKHPKVSNQIKFNALLLLKELMKSNSKSLIDYLVKKFLTRLYKLASSNLAELCLLKYDNLGDRKVSAAFYHLLLECFGRWGQNYAGVNNNYLDKMNKLLKMKRLPVEMKYWDVPREMMVTGDQKDDLKSILEAFKFERVKLIELIRYVGNEHLNDQQIQEEFRIYEEEKEKIDANKDIQTLLNTNYSVQNLDDKDLANEFQNELMMFDVMFDAHSKLRANDPLSVADFYQKIQLTHFNLFASNIDFTQPSKLAKSSRNGNNEIYEDKNYDVPVYHNDQLQGESNRNIDQDNQFGNRDNNQGSARKMGDSSDMNEGDRASHKTGDARKKGGSDNGLVNQNRPNRPEAPVIIDNRRNYNDNDDRRYRKEGNLQRIPEAEEFNNSMNRDGLVSPKKSKIASLAYLNSNDLKQNGLSRKSTIGKKNDQGIKRGSDRPMRILESKSIEDDLGYNNQKGRSDRLRNGNQGTPERRYQNSRLFSDKGLSGKSQKSQKRLDTNPDQLNDNNLASYKSNVFKTEGNYRSVGNRDYEENQKNPFRNQPLNNSKEFYKSYFAASTNMSHYNRSNNDPQFKSDAMNFVNGMYHDIQHTIARNVE